MIQAVLNSQHGRPFTAKYAGECAMTGMTFNAGDSIRPCCGGYISQRALGLTDLRMGADLASTLERTRPFDLDALTAWLDAGAAVVVYNRRGQPKRYDARNRGSSRQLAARTKAAAWIVKVSR